MRLQLFRPAGTLAEADDPVVVVPGTVGWDFCGLRVLRLGPGKSRRLDTADDEAVLLPLSGACSIQVDRHRFELAGRPDVFTRVSDFVYIPPETRAVVTSETGGEFALASARADQGLPARRLPADGIAVEVRGAGIATRQVNNLLSADVPHARRLMVVEVLTPAGNWSSWPPHKHDEWSDCEVPLEEIYYFRIEGAGGFGLHRTYTGDGAIDETVTVRDGDVFLIPRGYHGPCVAAPGHTMYYLNVMAGPGEQRVWRVCDDPAYSAVRAAWADEAVDPRVPLSTTSGPPSEGSAP